MKKIKKICVLLVDRANYGRMYPVMSALNKDPDLELQVICVDHAAGAFRRSRKWLKTMIQGRSSSLPEVEGSVPVTMSRVLVWELLNSPMYINSCNLICFYLSAIVMKHSLLRLPGLT